MKCLLNKYYFNWPVVVVTICILSMLSGCNWEGANYRFFTTDSHSPAQQVLHSFTAYVHTISSPDFPLASYQSNTKLYERPIYTQEIQRNKNVQFFPAVLWQIYALQGQSKWKDMAENYSTVLYQDDIVEKLIYDEAILYVYLTRYLVEQNPTAKSSFLDILAKYVANQERPCGWSGHANGCIEQLLGNDLLFLASKETGDPVYAQLAQNNSEFVFEHYFQNSQVDPLYATLAECETIPPIETLAAIGSEDLYNLAVIFYGFTILDNQQENERYHLLCVSLAKLFTSIFTDTHAKGPIGLVAKKIDLLPQTLVCLALYALHDDAENDYRETAEKIFKQILDRLQQSDPKKKAKRTPLGCTTTYSSAFKKTIVYEMVTQLARLQHSTAKDVLLSLITYLVRGANLST